MADAQESNYFGTFLETVQARENEPDQGSAPIELIRLVEQQGPIKALDLQAALHLDLIAFSNAVQAMKDAHLVELTGQAGDEKVELTEQGHRLAELQTAIS